MTAALAFFFSLVFLLIETYSIDFSIDLTYLRELGTASFGFTESTCSKVCSIIMLLSFLFLRLGCETNSIILS